MPTSSLLGNPPWTLAFLNPGPAEIVIILFFIFLLFGAKKIPELMRSLGRAQGEYQHAKRQFEREVGMREGDDIMEKMRRRAEALGIDTKGKDLDELQRAIAARGGDTSND
jgi:sec-independent protein translocase protein TatA